MDLNEKNIRKAIKGKAGVRAYSKKLRKRIRDGVEVDEKVIKIYVEEKLPRKALAAVDLIPSEIDGIPTDVEAIGKPVAMGTKDKIRPLIAGYSIGNIKITAGTLGWYFEKGGKIYLGSNAHVFSDNIGPVATDRRIMQPGSADGGELPAVATLIWHKSLKRGLNPFNALWMILVNLIYQLFGQPPPYDLTDSEPCHLDFAVAEALVDYVFDIDGLSDWDDFTGIFFAGSDSRSFFCKAKYILQEGYIPVDCDVKEAEMGDIVFKGNSRTTPYAEGVVLDDSVYIWVSYGGLGNDRPFDDVVMTEKMIEGGDSGTIPWLHAVRS